MKWARMKELISASLNICSKLIFIYLFIHSTYVPPSSVVHTLLVVNSEVLYSMHQYLKSDGDSIHLISKKYTHVHYTENNTVLCVTCP